MKQTFCPRKCTTSMEHNTSPGLSNMPAFWKADSMRSPLHHTDLLICSLRMIVRVQPSVRYANNRYSESYGYEAQTHPTYNVFPGTIMGGFTPSSMTECKTFCDVQDGRQEKNHTHLPILNTSITLWMKTNFVDMYKYATSRPYTFYV